MKYSSHLEIYLRYNMQLFLNRKNLIFLSIFRIRLIKQNKLEIEFYLLGPIFKAKFLLFQRDILKTKAGRFFGTPCYIGHQISDNI